MTFDLEHLEEGCKSKHIHANFQLPQNNSRFHTAAWISTTSRISSSSRRYSSAATLNLPAGTSQGRARLHAHSGIPTEGGRQRDSGHARSSEAVAREDPPLTEAGWGKREGRWAAAAWIEQGTRCRPAARPAERLCEEGGSATRSLPASSGCGSRQKGIRGGRGRGSCRRWERGWWPPRECQERRPPPRRGISQRPQPRLPSRAAALGWASARESRWGGGGWAREGRRGTARRGGRGQRKRASEREEPGERDKGDPTKREEERLVQQRDPGRGEESGRTFPEKGLERSGAPWIRTAR